MNLIVNCGAAEKVAAALAQGADRSERLFITIRGKCHETVRIDRDDVTLTGESLGDGLASPDSSTPVSVAGGQRVALRQLTLQGGHFALLVSEGAAVTGEDLRITGARYGVSIWDGTVRLWRSVIEQNETNVSVELGGHLFLSLSTVRNAGFLGIDVFGGSAQLEDVIVEGNATGLGMAQAHVFISGSQIRQNGTGMWLHGEGVRIDTSVIADNTGDGIGLAAATAEVMGGTRVENNTETGIQAMIGSRVIVDNWTFIRNNGGHGIWLKGTSVVSGFDSVGTQITGNTQHGIFCDPAPAVAQIGPHYSGSGFILNATHVFDNVQGQIRCPGIVVQ